MGIHIAWRVLCNAIDTYVHLMAAATGDSHTFFVLIVICYVVNGDDIKMHCISDSE